MQCKYAINNLHSFPSKAPASQGSGVMLFRCQLLRMGKLIEHTVRIRELWRSIQAWYLLSSGEMFVRG